jgi:peptidoglycan/LPS O-acetylase OafA/YrhL
VTRGFSIYLDLVRFVAAVVVLLSHFGYPRFSDGRWLWVRELNLGSDAVVLFFVLSGLVIAHVAESKSGGLQRFTFDRATRLISVALPVLLLGFVLDRFGARVAPEGYSVTYYNEVPFWYQMLRGLSFSNEWAVLPVRLGSNGPYWSLSYEAAYYAFFAVAFYLRGVRRVGLLMLGCAVVGAPILFLMPAWLLGVQLYRGLQRRQPLPRSLALLYAVMPVVFYPVALWGDLPAQLYSWTAHIDAALSLRFSNEFLWNNILAVFVCVHLYGMASLLRDNAFGKATPLIKWAAGGSFSLYLVHYPVMQFLAVFEVWPSFAPLYDLVFLGVTLMVCYLFAAIFERPLPYFREMLTGRFPAFRQLATNRAR